MPTDLADQEAAVMRDERRERIGLLTLALPALVIVGLLLLAPLGWLLYQSFVDQEGAWTLAHYARIWNDPGYRATFVLTFEISFLVTALAILIGFPLSYLLSQLTGAWAAIGLALVIVPFWTSLLVRTYAWLVLLQRKGLINNTLIDLGLISEPLTLVHNYAGTVISMLHIMLPFMILPLYGVLKGIPPLYMKAAASLGAGPIKRFFWVYLPLAAPGLVAGGLMVFIQALGYYITPALVGGASDQMLSFFVANYTTDTGNWGMAATLGLIMLVITLVLYAIAQKLSGGRTQLAG